MQYTVLTQRQNAMIDNCSETIYFYIIKSIFASYNANFHVYFNNRTGGL